MRRLFYVMTTYFVALAIDVSPLLHPSPKLIWNASASVPIGLYALQPDNLLKDGDLVIAKPPEPLATFLAERRYLPRGVPLLKHVAALPGEIVCRHGLVITINGISVASALTRDSAGRLLPVWQGCNKLTPNEAFLLNRAMPNSSKDGISGRCQ